MMPVYCYVCPNCGKKIERVRRVAARNDLIFCTGADNEPGKVVPGIKLCAPMERDINAENVNSPDLPYQKPIYSDAMAVDPGQVAAFSRENPEMTVLKDGRIAIESHSEHKRVMKKLGFHDNKGYN